MGAEINQIAHSSSYKLSLWLLIYAFNYALFHILPSFLNYEIDNCLMIADLFDIFTPFVMIFLIYKIYRILTSNSVETAKSFPRYIIRVILILGLVAFVEGHGMHLSANAIARHLIGMEGSSLFALVYFFDESLGHILWHSGIVLLSVGLILMGLDNQMLNVKPILTIFASLLYGFTYFVTAVEGQTVIFTFPLAVVIPSVIGWLAHQRGILFSRNLILSFYFFAYILALCLFILWGIWNKGFPQFSELGWI